MDLYDRNILTNTNLKYVDSSSNYYIIMIVQKFEKNQKIKNFQFFSHSRGMKCRVEANNNRKAIVVCGRYVVNQPSKRSALVYLYY